MVRAYRRRVREDGLRLLAAARARRGDAASATVSSCRQQSWGYPNFTLVHRKLAPTPRVTRQRSWGEYKGAHPEGLSTPPSACTNGPSLPLRGLCLGSVPTRRHTLSWITPVTRFRSSPAVRARSALRDLWCRGRRRQLQLHLRGCEFNYLNADAPAPRAIVSEQPKERCGEGSWP